VVKSGDVSRPLIGAGGGESGAEHQARNLGTAGGGD
jgi:hypothetical protein